MDLEPEDLDFSAVVRGVIKRFGQQVPVDQIRLDLAPITGRSDRLRFEQVVANLVSNAVKYGNSNPIDIVLRAEGDLVRLAVKDRGIGIAPDDQRRLFERFARAVPRRQYGGFGLGLWIARETVRVMGGQIALESQPGQGSTFTVSFPRMLAVKGR
jgi:signal transduction histidine kinase